MMFWEILLSEHVCNTFISFEKCRKHCERTIEARVIDVQTRGYPITKSSNWIPVIGHPRDFALRTNHDREFSL